MSMRQINEIIVHCTATPAGRAVSVSEIDAWHRARGWSGIGYHRVIGLNGERWAGRPMEQIGAHCEGHNTGTIGVTYVGGLASDARTAKDTRTNAQKLALVSELIDLRDRFNIQKISGHNDYANKACPCFDATKEFAGLLKERGRNFTPIIDKVLKRGDVGPDVAQWCEQLVQWHHSAGVHRSFQVSTVFDHDVEMATLDFQRTRGIVIDGKVGPQTMAEMGKVLA